VQNFGAVLKVRPDYFQGLLLILRLGGIQACRHGLVLSWVPCVLGVSANKRVLCTGTEKPLGEAIRKSGVRREELFVTTKLP